MLKEVIATLTEDSELNEKAEYYYRAILDQAFEWQRSGYIRKRHLDNSATYMKEPFAERAPAEWYNQIILEFEDELNRAVEAKDFERAIKWRDALMKIKAKTDIYDVLHVVDELWSARSIPELKPFLEHVWEDFSEGIQEYMRNQKGELGKLTQEDFNAWKDSKKPLS
jgi:hypothetical protein